LLDAPCSGEGLRTAKRGRSRPVDEARRRAFHNRQVHLIESAFRALKPGGQLVYATCSLAPEEDEAVVDALLHTAGGVASVEAVRGILPLPAPGVDSYRGASFLPDVHHAVRLWPYVYDTTGFFAAVIGKKDVFAGERLAPPHWSLEEAAYRHLTFEEREQLVECLLQTYGFDIEEPLHDHQLTLRRRDSRVYAIPELYLSSFESLPCVSLGMMIGQYSDAGFTPSHELVSRFWPRFSLQRLQVDSDQARVWLDGRDLRGLRTPVGVLGSVVLVEDERHRFLGRGKILDKRIRNLLPRRLIR